MPGPFLDQLGPQPGVVPQRPDLRRWHETRPQHAPLAKLREPHGIELVGLGPAGDLLDVTGVDQPHRQTGRLQQVEERPPVVRRRLQLHPLDSEGDQVRPQRQNRGRGRLDLPHLRGAATLDRGMRAADTHHPGRFGHIDRGGHGQDPFVLVLVDLYDIADHQEHLNGSTGDGTSEPGGPGGIRKSARRARSTVRCPSDRGPHQAELRPQDQKTTA